MCCCCDASVAASFSQKNSPSGAGLRLLLCGYRLYLAGGRFVAGDKSLHGLPLGGPSVGLGINGVDVCCCGCMCLRSSWSIGPADIGFLAMPVHDDPMVAPLWWSARLSYTRDGLTPCYSAVVCGVLLTNLNMCAAEPVSGLRAPPLAVWGARVPSAG
eukprot:4047350-Amphidinium_carterae.1